MTGKTTLILTDAASGREVKRVEKHNMVTNALKNIFSPPKEIMFNGYNISSSLKGLMPMYKYTLGGVLLIANAVEENPDKFMLLPKHGLTGYAGGEYSGTDVMRGSLNTNETYATDNGYHFTWDFDTDKANGMIHCVSLTNKHFGNSGSNPANSDGGTASDINSPSSINCSSAINLASFSGKPIGMFEKGVLTFCSAQSSKPVLTRVRLIDPLHININDAPGGKVETSTVVDCPFTFNLNKMNFVNNTTRKVYFFYSKAISGTDTTAVNWCMADPISGNVLDGGVTNVVINASVNAAAIYENKLYLAFTTMVGVYSLSGELLRSIPIRCSSFYERDGVLYALGTSNSVNVLTSLNDENNVCYRTGCSVPVPTKYINLPYTIHTQASTTTYTTYMAMFTNYLATINNLAEPIIKTEAQTLKIIYDITDD